MSVMSAEKPQPSPNLAEQMPMKYSPQVTVMPQDPKAVTGVAETASQKKPHGALFLLVAFIFILIALGVAAVFLFQSQIGFGI